MVTTTVNPTRMELTRLKARLKTASRGYKLLKDKRDELMKQFLDVVRQCRQLRTEVEQGLQKANRAFTIASALMSPEMLQQSLMYPMQTLEAQVTVQNIMGVYVPKYSFTTDNNSASNIYTYGFAQTSGELDLALEALSGEFEKLLRLAELEKTAQLLAGEIEKTRRRVNALEYVMIPDLQSNIRYITMKLEENERGNISRLMKVKEGFIR